MDRTELLSRLAQAYDAAADRVRRMPEPDWRTDLLRRQLVALAELGRLLTAAPEGVAAALAAQASAPRIAGAVGRLTARDGTWGDASSALHDLWAHLCESSPYLEE